MTSETPCLPGCLTIRGRGGDVVSHSPDCPNAKPAPEPCQHDVRITVDRPQFPYCRKCGTVQPATPQERPDCGCHGPCGRADCCERCAEPEDSAPPQDAEPVEWQSLHDGVWGKCECLNDDRRSESSFPHRIKPKDPVLDEAFVNEWFAKDREILALRDRLAAAEQDIATRDRMMDDMANKAVKERGYFEAAVRDLAAAVAREEQAEAKLAAAEKRVEPDSCEWDFDDCGTWNSTCGNAFQFTEGGPTENGCKFCPYCGHALKEIPAKFDEWGDLICDTVCTVCDGAGCPDCCQECEGKGCAKCEKERAR